MTENKGTTITEADIEKLASLSRMSLSAEEKGQFAKEIGSILGYIDQIKEVSEVVGDTAHTTAKISHKNILREDVVSTGTPSALNPDPKVLVSSAPQSEDGYVKVKKILG